MRDGGAATTAAVRVEITAPARLIFNISAETLHHPHSPSGGGAKDPDAHMHMPTQLLAHTRGPTEIHIHVQPLGPSHTPVLACRLILPFPLLQPPWAHWSSTFSMTRPPALCTVASSGPRWALPAYQVLTQ